MSDSHLISTPALTNKHLVKLELPEISTKSYQHTLGALMYPMLETHPNLSYTIAALGHHVTNPGLDHQRALKHIFRYLRATSGKQLIFRQGASSGSTLFGYADADWASDINDHKSTSGYIFKLAGATVSWSSKKQTSIALSISPPRYVGELPQLDDHCDCAPKWHCDPHNACFIHDLCFCKGSSSWPPVKPIRSY
jgi:hypothetical protein